MSNNITIAIIVVSFMLMIEVDCFFLFEFLQITHDTFICFLPVLCVHLSIKPNFYELPCIELSAA
jgi:hypothetical protein